MTTADADLMNNKPLPRVQETRLKRAATMATYLRSALGRASEKLVAGAAETTTENEEDLEEGEPNQDDNQAVEKVNEEDYMAKRVEKSERCESGTASSSGRTDEALELQPHEGEPTETKDEAFTVHVDSQETAETEDKQHLDTKERESKAWTYCDVLLQSDDHGLGLNLCVAVPPESFPHRMTQEGDRVVMVVSFRRLHDKDTGPAESSGQIRVGDVLDSIDGFPVESLEAVANVFSMKLECGTRPFVLLRFLRQSKEGSVDTEMPHTPLTALTQEKHSGSDDLWTRRPDVAMLIRELVVKNQRLEEQVLASRLKQDEQRIQLEQLHTLYAKTQLESWSAFSLPKPLSLRAPFNMRRPSDASSKANSSLSTAAARLIGVVNPAQYDVEFAVNAERERLTRQFEQRLEAERRQLQSQHDASVQALQAAAEKKIRMLEFGVKQLLQSPRTVSSSETAEVSAQVQILRHQLLHRNNEAKAGDDEKPKRDCVLCLLVSETHSVETEMTSRANEADAWRAQINVVLEEYDGVQAARKPQLTEVALLNQQPVTSSHDEDAESIKTEPAASA